MAWHGCTAWHGCMAWHGMAAWHGCMAWLHGIAAWHGGMAWRHGMAAWHGRYMAWLVYGMARWIGWVGSATSCREIASTSWGFSQRSCAWRKGSGGLRFTCQNHRSATQSIERCLGRPTDPPTHRPTDPPIDADDRRVAAYPIEQCQAIGAAPAMQCPGPRFDRPCLHAAAHMHADKHAIVRDDDETGAYRREG